jgi:hypothetical protein
MIPHGTVPMDTGRKGFWQTAAIVLIVGDAT